MYKAEIDGVHVKIPPGGVELRGGRGRSVGSDVDEGLGEIKVTRGDLEAGGSTSLSAVRRDMELMREWNELQRRASRGEMDFFDYEAEMGLWMERRRIRSDLETMSEYETTLRVRCPFCGRTYRLLVRMENPLRALEAMDSIEAFRRLGVDLRRHAKHLARVGFKRGFESPEAYLKHLKSLAEVGDLMEEVAERLREEVEALLKKVKTRFATPQLRRILERFAVEYRRECERLLKGELRVLISDFRS